MRDQAGARRCGGRVPHRPGHVAMFFVFLVLDCVHQGRVAGPLSRFRARGRSRQRAIGAGAVTGHGAGAERVRRRPVGRVFFVGVEPELRQIAARGLDASGV